MKLPASFKKYIPYLILTLILVGAGILRLYRIQDYMSFLGDEGRDALIVKQMIVDHKFTLLGPVTSVGLMYLGPMYYYFMVPFLFITNLDPVGPAIMVALFSVATVFLIWQAAKEFFGIRVAAISAILYATSPLVLIYSHSSWNPNILPFWGLLLIYSLTRVVVHHQYKWLIVTGLSLGITLQLHYVSLVYIPIIVTILLLVRSKIPLKYLGFLVGGAVLMLLPFIFFELRHQFINSITVFKFITRTGESKTFGLVSPLYKFWDLTVRLFWRLIVIKNAELAIGFLVALFVSVIHFLIQLKPDDPKRKILIIFILWYGVGFTLLSFYTGVIYDYYLMFAFPLPFLLTGIVFDQLAHKNIGKVLVLIILAVLVTFHVQNSPLNKPPNRIVMQTRDIAHFILSKTGNNPYNFALIAGGNSNHAYRYFLEVDGYPPVTIENPTVDPERKSVTGQLFIVCEESECRPLGHSLWEIAGFGRAEIEEEWKVGLFKVFKLVPYYESTVSS